MSGMLWERVSRNDVCARELADRHYSRQTIGAPGFTPPGRVLVLVLPDGDAVWATSWPYPEYVNRVFPEAWVCSLFRNESRHLSSCLIRQAVAATRFAFGSPSPDGIITMVDPGKVRRKRDPGRCFLRAGFRYVLDGDGKRLRTKERGFLVLRQMPEDMPEPAPPAGHQLRLEALA